MAEEVIELIRSALISTKGKSDLRTLQKDFKMIVGEDIPYKQLGHASLEQLLRSIPSLEVTRGPGGQVLVDAIASSSSQHIVGLVNRQKASKKPRRVSHRPTGHHRHVQNKRWGPPLQDSQRPAAAAAAHRQSVIRAVDPRASNVAGRLAGPPAPRGDSYPSAGTSKPGQPGNPTSRMDGGPSAGTSKTGQPGNPTNKMDGGPGNPTNKTSQPGNPTNKTSQPGNLTNKTGADGAPSAGISRTSQPGNPTSKMAGAPTSKRSAPSNPTNNNNNNNATAAAWGASINSSAVNDAPSVHSTTPATAAPVEFRPGASTPRPRFNFPPPHQQQLQQPILQPCIPAGARPRMRSQNSFPPPPTEPTDLPPPPPPARKLSSSDESSGSDSIAGGGGGDSVPQFLELVRLTHTHHLAPPQLKVVPRPSKRPGARCRYDCSVRVDGRSYQSYPQDCFAREHAILAAATEALADVRRRYGARPSPPRRLATTQDLLERLPALIRQHYGGIWAAQVRLDYEHRYGERLPADWLELLATLPLVSVEPTLDHSKCVLKYGVHEKNNSNAQSPTSSSSSSSLSPVAAAAAAATDFSVPSNTVRLGDGELALEVTFAASPLELWCRQLDTADAERFERLQERLAEYYSTTTTSTTTSTSVNVGGFYVAQHEDMWFRVRVLPPTPAATGTAGGGGDLVHCFLLDSGDELHVPPRQLRRLEREFARVPAQAFVCRLAGLEELAGLAATARHLDALHGRPFIAQVASDESPSTTTTTAAIPVVLFECQQPGGGGGGGGGGGSSSSSGGSSEHLFPTAAGGAAEHAFSTGCPHPGGSTDQFDQHAGGGDCQHARGEHLFPASCQTLISSNGGGGGGGGGEHWFPTVNKQLVHAITRDATLTTLEPNRVTNVYCTHAHHDTGELSVQLHSEGRDKLLALLHAHATVDSSSAAEQVGAVGAGGEVLYLRSGHRCTVHDLSPDGRYAQLHYVDTGRTEIVPSSAPHHHGLVPLAAVSDVLCAFPALAVRVRLCEPQHCPLPPGFGERALALMPETAPVLLRVLPTTTSSGAVDQEEEAVPLCEMFQREPTTNVLFSVHECLLGVARGVGSDAGGGGKGRGSRGQESVQGGGGSRVQESVQRGGQENLLAGGSRGQNNLQAGGSRGQENLQAGGRVQESVQAGGSRGQENLQGGGRVQDNLQAGGSRGQENVKRGESLKGGRVQEHLPAGVQESVMGRVLKGAVQERLKGGGEHENPREARVQESAKRDSVQERLKAQDRAQERLKKGRALESLKKDRAEESLKKDRAEENWKRERAEESLKKDRAEENWKRERAEESLKKDRAEESLNQERTQETLNQDRAQESKEEEGEGEEMDDSWLPATPLPPPHVFLDVRVAAARSPWDFSVQPYSSYTQLQQLMARIQLHYNNTNNNAPPLAQVRPGAVFAARHADGQWYRARVLRTTVANNTAAVKTVAAVNTTVANNKTAAAPTTATVHVLYCDFGDGAQVAVAQLAPLAAEFRRLPPQALRARLAGVRPRHDGIGGGGGGWPPEDCAWFRERVREQTFVSVVVDTTLGAAREGEEEEEVVLSLKLYDTSTIQDVEIDVLLVERGMALAQPL